MLFTEQDKKVLEKYFGKNAPVHALQASSMIHNYEHGYTREPLPPAVYLALQNLVCSEMGNKINPKKLDRKNGKEIRKKRTGSRKG